MPTSQTARDQSTKIRRPWRLTGRKFFDLTTRTCPARQFVLAMAGLACFASSALAQILPTDAQQTATVPPSTFAQWFSKGHPTVDGVVTPANSVTFSNDPTLANVDFYQWSERMFLWLTSPAPPEYGGGGRRIFSSAAFFDVSPVNGNNRTLIPHEVGRVPTFNLRAAQPGPHGLPVVVSKTGDLFEVAPAARNPQQEHLILNGEGKSTGFKQLKIEGTKAAFLNDAGQAIANAKPIFSPQLQNSQVLQRFTLNNRPVFLNQSGNVVDVEIGEAETGGVLLRQDRTLIYYGIAVNDVYAYFLTGTKGGGITPAPTQFPTTQAELQKIVDFANLHNKKFLDQDALAIEVKTAWVEAAGLANPNSYITMMGTVPTYDTGNPTKWTPKGQKTVLLALVGIHVVGSASGHPELIWATFEHFGNSPNGAYTYNSINGPNPKTVPQKTTGNWLFCASGANSGFNEARQGVNGAEIDATPPATPPDPAIPGTIGTSNTIRFKPFGGATNQDPNPLVPSVAASNTQIISINQSVIGQLVGSDVRKNYYLLGATWTAGGGAPTAPFPNGNGVGTSQLANSTMETFQTGTNGNFGRAFNCFSCHNNQDALHPTNSPNATTNVSHIYDAIQKLF